MSGNFTAGDAEMMKSFSKLQKDGDLLSAEMSDVICLRDYVGRRGQPQMDINWLNNVRTREGEVDELQKKINEMPRDGSTNLYACHKLNKKVIACLRSVVVLKREANYNVVAHRVVDSAILEGNVLRNGDGSSRSVKTVLKHLEKIGPISFSPDELKSYTSDFSTTLGSGGFGVVYKGQFPNGVLFAVKRLHMHLKDESVSKQFLAEVGTMGRTYHRNLVRVYGYCFHDRMKAIVYEYMEKGSLHELLKDPKIEWRKVYNIVTDTAKGLSYLHENCHPHIIHLDIKPENVLIDSDFCSKVADYGLAKHYKWSLSHVTLTKLEGTYGYMAPELCLDYSFRGTSKCDVYSFGRLLFKVLESKKKGENERWFPAEVLKKFKEGKLEELLNDCGIEEIDREDAVKLVLVALCCTQYYPQDRPSMSTVVKTLEGDIQAWVPPNLLLPQIFSSGLASMTPAEENKNMLSSIHSSLGITKDGDYTTERSTSFKFPVSSETSLAFAEQMPVEFQCPVQKHRVEIEKKNQENKGIKPEVKNDEVTTVVLKVGMHCVDCARKIKKSLVKMEGVLTADADQGNSLVTVKCGIDPNKLVDCIWKEHKKRANIVQTEPEKKPEEKVVEPGNKTGDKKEEGVVTKQETKSEGKGAVEIKLKKQVENLGIAKTEQEKEEKAKAELKRSQEGSREEKRKRKSEKKREEELGRVKTKPEARWGAGETEVKKKGQKRIIERRVSMKINPEEEEEEEEKSNEILINNKTEETRVVKMNRKTEENPEEIKRVEEEFTYLREKIQNAYDSSVLSDENSYSCTIQ